MTGCSRIVSAGSEKGCRAAFWLVTCLEFERGRVHATLQETAMSVGLMLQQRSAHAVDLPQARRGHAAL